MQPLEQKTMTPTKSPRCRKCRGLKTVKAVVKGVEKDLPCPLCGGTGKGKLVQK